jgi:hypothetical protein
MFWKIASVSDPAVCAGSLCRKVFVSRKEIDFHLKGAHSMETITRRSLIGSLALAAPLAALSTRAFAAEAAASDAAAATATTADTAATGASAAADAAATEAAGTALTLDATCAVSSLQISYPSAWTADSEASVSSITIAAPDTDGNGTSEIVVQASLIQTGALLDITDEQSVELALYSTFENILTGMDADGTAHPMRGVLARADGDTYVAAKAELQFVSGGITCGGLVGLIVTSDGDAYSFLAAAESTSPNYANAIATFDAMWGALALEGSSGTVSDGSSMLAQQAVEVAQHYLENSPFSREQLINQLKYEGYSDADAEWAADNCGADWNEQAALKAQSYIDNGLVTTHDDMISQLTFDGFTADEAAYGAAAVGL